MWVRSAATPPAEDCQPFPSLSPSPRFSVEGVVPGRGGPRLITEELNCLRSLPY